MTTDIAEMNAEIRKQYKAEGIKASVRIGAGYCSIQVRVKSGSFRRAEEIAKGYQCVQRDEFGDILSGGNLFVNVEWSSSTIDAQVAKIRSTFEDAIRGLDVGENCSKDGWTVIRESTNDYRVRDNSAESRLAWGADGAMKLLARMMLESN